LRYGEEEDKFITMKRIYVAEDHEVIRNGVCQYLELSGFEVLGCPDLASEREAVEKRIPDLIIQDVMLPDGDGFLYIKELKASHPLVPVIFMTARTDESDRILGFELGCDDYISKPFSPKELVLRVQALFRRVDGSAETQSHEAKERVFRSGGDELLINEETHRLSINGTEIPLTAAEWRIVVYLAANEGALVSRGQILETCFDYSFESYERVVDTHIKNIRAKLKPGSWIETVRGYGYRFLSEGGKD